MRGLTRVVLEDGRATGVEYLHKGKLQSANASKEVLLSAGAVQSPQLLKLFGYWGR